MRLTYSFGSFLLVLLPALVVSAPAANAQAPRIGTYTLVSVDDLPVPAETSNRWFSSACFEEEPMRSRFSAGSLSLFRTSHVVVHLSAAVGCGAAAPLDEFEDVDIGPASFVGDSIHFTQGDRSLTGVLAGDTIRVGGLVWVRSTAVPDGDLYNRAYASHQYRFYDQDEWIKRMRVAEQHMERTGYPYKCAGDALLDVPLSDPDTAGLGAMVAAGAPGWRLGDARAIACSGALNTEMREIAGSHPAEALPMLYGTGKAWWTARGDFDGDGEEDRAVSVLMGQGERLRVGVLVGFANGRFAIAEHLVFPRVRFAGSRFVTCEGEVRVPVDSFSGDGLIVYFDGAKGAFTRLEDCGYSR
jgi:hypothetical protein